MKVHTYENAFLAAGAAVLIVCMAALAYAAVALGIQLPGRVGAVDPKRLATTAPFDHPGVRQTGPASYEAVVVGRVWAFDPPTITVPRDADITFVGTSADVIHGFHVGDTRVNVMLIPGQITRVTHRFHEPGEYLLLCHEYCGLGHHTMAGKVVVQ